MKILVTGSAGFIGGYLVKELIDNNHEVIGIDNFSKYGEPLYTINDKRYLFVKGDVKDISLMKDLISECDQVVSLAAMVGGVSFFNAYPYDLLSENDLINNATFNSAIWAFKRGQLKKINVISSSMVYENTNIFPTSEGSQLICPPPNTTYGFQKLATEYYARAAFQQYGLPFTIIRLYNCVGTGEIDSIINSNNKKHEIKITFNHVIPDLIKKVLSGQDPLIILGDGNQVRNFTYVKDTVKGIRLCIEKKEAINEDFNISTNESTTVLELAKMIWTKINKKPFRYISEKPFKDDVKVSIPDTNKSKKLLGFNPSSSLSDILDEIISWIRQTL